jgi:starch-binding outer membrane protein, SusD/RagB family
MKNNILKLSAVAFAVITAVSSCKKEYLETSPTDSIAAVDAFKTTANAYAALNGIHRSLYIQYYSQQDQGGQGANMIYMDMLGEDLVNTTQGNGWFISTYRWLAHRSATGSVPYFNYRFYYTIIANANMIIDNVDKAAGPDSEKKMIKGQALAYRGWAYFQMIQLFGERYDATGANNTLGLPLITSSTDGIKPRSTVAEVYTQINADLDAAITLLTGAPARFNQSHINLSVAQGFKARVALTQQNWAVAATMAAAARTGYTLMSTATQYLSGFNKLNNTESMWASQQIPDQTTYFYSFFAYMSADFNSTNIRTNPKAINSTLYDAIPATDIRKQVWDPTGTNTAFPTPPGGIRAKYMNRKFLSGGGSTSSIGDVIMMRASEMYLIEAEARARAGQFTLAQDAIFALNSKRDPSYVKTTLTGQQLIDHIMFYRRVELWGEGFRFLDLKRLNLPLNRNGANHDASVAVIFNVPAGDKQWVWLIPQDEINNSNGVVVQNPL